MKLSKTKSNKILEGDLTPMIDMTFQLIGSGRGNYATGQ